MQRRYRGDIGEMQAGVRAKVRRWSPGLGPRSPRGPPRATKAPRPAPPAAHRPRLLPRRQHRSLRHRPHRVLPKGATPPSRIRRCAASCTPYISAVSPLYLRYISTVSPLYLPYISSAGVQPARQCLQARRRLLRAHACHGPAAAARRRLRRRRRRDAQAGVLRGRQRRLPLGGALG